MKKTMKMVPLELRAEFTPSSVDEKDKTATLVWSTGARVLRQPWWGEEYYEELAMDPENIRLDRLNQGAPLLNSHQARDVSNVFGSIQRAWLEKGQGMAKVKFSDREEVEPVFKDVQSGVLRNISVGYRVHQYLDVTPLNEKIKVFRAIDWEPFEVSIVPIPADAAAGFRDGSKESFTCEIIQRAESAIQGDSMDPKENKVTAPVAAEQVDDTAAKLEGARAEGQKLERERILEIKKAVRMASLDESFAEDLIGKGVAVDAARAMVLEKLAARTEQVETRNHPRVEVAGLDEIKTRRDGISEALLHRYDPTSFKLTEKGQEFRGMTMLRIAEELVGAKRARGMSKLDLAQRAMSTSDFPEILANTAGKTLRKGYEDEPRTFLPWCVPGTLPDYKQVSRVALGEGPNLAKVLEGGEFTIGSVGEGAEKYSVADYGKILVFTLQAMVNDDMQAFTRIPRMFGAAAGRIESDIVYAFMTGSHEMADEVELFDVSDHKNTVSSGTTIPNGIAAARALMRKQKGLDGKANLNLTPKFLIVGPDKEEEALKQLTAVLAAQTSNVNIYANAMSPVIESRITGNKWFLAASPSQIDTIEYSYLEGMNGPEITTQEGFEVDGVKIKCKHVFGAKPLDYRGLFYNSGA